MRAAVKPLGEKLNARLMKRLGKSQRQLFEELDKPTLKALPSTRYEFSRWEKVRVHIDYQVAFDGHFYSVPYQLGQAAYRRASRLFDELARGDGTHALLLKRLAKSNILILDDFGLDNLNAQQRKDLLEVRRSLQRQLDHRDEPARAAELARSHRRRDARRRDLRSPDAQRRPRETRWRLGPEENES